MPQSSQLHRNRPLENISMAFKPTGFIADELSPRFMVENESNEYYVYSKDNFRVPETVRADGAESNKDSFALSVASYQLVEHSLHDDITDRQRSNADKAIRLDIDATESLTQKIMLRREIDLQTTVQTSGIFSNALSLTSTYAWSANTTLSNPITQIDSVSTAILTSSGVLPNVIALDDPSFRAAKEHVSIVDRVKYTSAESVGEALLAKLWGLDKVLVGKATYNSAQEGLTDTLSRVWTDTAVLCYVDQNPGLKKISALYTFWQNQGGVPYRVKKWREEKIEADRIEVQSMFDNKIVASECAGVIVNCVQ